MLINQGKGLEVSAEKAGISEKTARKYLHSGKLPEELRKGHTWRTREDPFSQDEKKMKDMLKENPLLEAKTLFEHFQSENPDRYSDGQLRTLQRRFRQWRALEGSSKEVIFPQVHHPGERCQSDFTSMNELNITIRGARFDHLLYHFILTYSNWQTGTICQSESFESLSEGLQRALWELGGVPKVHQSDSLSAAVRNTDNPETFTDRYLALIRHYGLKAQKIEPGKANQNGDTEQSHNRLKKMVAQQLMLRGSRDFESHEDYRIYLEKIFRKLNSRNSAKIKEEVKYLRALPSQKIDCCKREIVRVKTWSTITVGHNIYSVPSRLIGEKVLAKLLPDKVEVWYAQKCVAVLPRLKGRKKHYVQYRHIIDYLLRKPGAFENYIYKDDLFPTHRFRVAYDYLSSVSFHSGTKEYLKILELAAKENETLVDDAIETLIREESAISFEHVRALVSQGQIRTGIQEIKITDVDTSAYDILLGASSEGVAA
jgi:transposase InsO family protein